MQARHAGGLFQNAPALLGLGGNDLADHALAHHGGRPRAGGRVCEQELDVAGAHLLAVHAVDGAVAALDAAAHLKLVGVVEGGRRGAVRIVQQQADFRHVAAGPVAGARKDHVVHAGCAHGLIGIFTHHPAKGFDEVGLAAPVRPHDACQAGLDLEIRRFTEALEADEPQTIELHTEIPTRAPTRAPRPKLASGSMSDDRRGRSRAPDRRQAAHRVQAPAQTPASNASQTARRRKPDCGISCAKRRRPYPHFRKGRKTFSISSSVTLPAMRTPLTKNVGVEFTPNCLAARSRTSEILL